MEPRLHQRLQMHGHDRLRDPVRDRGHAEHSDPAAVRLGDLHRPDRRRKVGPRAHPIPDLVEVVPQIGLELVQRPARPLPAAPLLALTRRYASHTIGLGIANGLSLGFGMFILASSQNSRPRLNEPTFLMSRPLRSTPTPASRSFTATTGRSASERRDRYSVPSVSASARSLSRPWRPAAPDDRFDARLLTFRARAADQAHAASTPGTTWPIHGHPPGSSRENSSDPSISMPTDLLIDASTAHAQPEISRPSASGTSSWSPPDAIKPRLFPGSLTTTVFSQRSTRAV